MDNTIDFQKAARKNRKSKLDKELWLSLLACLSDVTQEDPWDLLEFGAPAAFIPQSADQMIFFNCMVDEETELFSILVSPSARDYNLLTAEGPHSFRQEMRRYIEQESFTVLFCPKELVPDDLCRIYRQLSLDFGDGPWPCIHYKRAGYTSQLPQRDQLAFLLDCMGNFVMLLRAAKTFENKPDFENGEMLLRFYSPEQQLWLNAAVPFSMPPTFFPSLLLQEDSPLLKELKGLSPSDSVRKMEFELGWITDPTVEKPRETPFFPQLVVLTDRETGDILWVSQCRKEEYLGCALDAWTNALKQYGIPKMLYVSRDESYDLFEDMAPKLGIKLKRVKRLPAAERFLREMDEV